MDTNREETKVFAEIAPPFGSEIRFWMRRRIIRDGAISTEGFAQCLFHARQPGDEGKEPPSAFTLTPGDAQQFMDELWRIGIRPTEGTGSAGALAAVQRHLEDMRSLVFRSKPKLQKHT